MAVHARSGGSATRAAPGLGSAARWWGALAGIGGLVHGVGEVAQGNLATPGLFIPSWSTGPIADNLGGEPGLTVVPNFLVTGVLTIAFAVLLVAVATWQSDRRGSGPTMLGLSAAMLLVGGGVGPPVIGLCAGAAALATRTTPASMRSPVWTALWPWLFWLSLTDTIFLVFGSLFAAFVLDVDVSTAFVVAFLGALVLLPFTVAVGRMSARKGPAT